MSTGAYNMTHLRSLLAPLICLFSLSLINYFYCRCVLCVCVFSSSFFLWGVPFLQLISVYSAILLYFSVDDEVMLNVLRCQLTY